MIISVLTHNRLDVTKRCLNSIFENTNGPYKVVVTDNASTDGTLDYLKDLAAQKAIVLVANKENICFSKAHNSIIKMFYEDDIVLMNNDVEVPFNWFLQMQDFIQEKKLGAASPAIKQYGGLNVGAVLDDHARGRSLVDDFDTVPDWITGSCLYITRETLDTIGNFDINYNFYYEDVDFCKKMKLFGVQFACNKNVQIIHHDSASSNPAQKKEMMEKSRQYFCKKWGYKL